MSAVPGWIQVFQALLTPIVAIAVGVVALFQWRTAHRKVVLDLFEKRLSVYGKAKDAVFKVVTSGQLSPEAVADLGAAADGATFLFGRDVQEYIEDLWRACSSLQTANASLEMGGGEDATKAKREAHQRILSFYNTAPEIFGSYMRMDQKLLRTPTEWLAERNKIRLSYADKKQQ